MPHHCAGKPSCCLYQAQNNMPPFQLRPRLGSPQYIPRGIPKTVLRIHTFRTYRAVHRCSPPGCHQRTTSTCKVRGSGMDSKRGKSWRLKPQSHLFKGVQQGLDVPIIRNNAKLITSCLVYLKLTIDGPYVIYVWSGWNI